MNSPVPVAHRPVACTIVARNYLAQARAFARSFKKYHPEGTIYVLLVDRIDGAFDPAKEPFITIPVEDLGIPDFPVWAFKYSILELSTAVKPFLLQYLLTTKNHDHVMYFDPDILCYAPMTPIFEALEKNAIVLIPHLTDPLPEDGFLPRQLDILRSGTYNLGFLAIRKTELVMKLLDWWHERLKLFCYVRLTEGLFVDQRWMDLVPGLFPDVHVLTDHGCDVAYWNVHNRIFEERNGSFLVDTVPLRFFHFSGFDPREPESLSKHQTRFALKDLPVVRELCDAYGATLNSEGMETLRPLPYTFGFFDDRTPIPAIARKIYEDPALQELFPNPFKTGTGSFYEFLQEPMEHIGEHGALTRLHLALYQVDTELQRFFPSIQGAHALTYGVHLLYTSGLPAAFLKSLEPLRQGRNPLSKRTRWMTFVKRRHHWPFYQRICRKARKAMGERLFTTLQNRMHGWTAEATRKEAPHLPAKMFGMNVLGYVTAESGLGEAVRGNIRALDTVKLPVALQNFDRTYARKLHKEYLPRLTTWNPYRFNLIHVNADQIRTCAEYVGLDFFRDRYNIGYWMWELSPFPKKWIPLFGSIQEVWTASTYTQKILAENAPIPVTVIPHVVEIAERPRKTREAFGLPADRFIFLFIFDFYSIFERKNPLAIIRAFEKAFPSGGPLLVLKTMNSASFPEESAVLERELRRIGGVHLSKVFAREDTTDLVACADAYVSLHRSEGFGLTLAEAMLLQIPIIATAFGGNTDFLHKENSFPIEASIVKLTQDYGPYPKDAVWGDPDIDQAAHAMQYVVTHPTEAAALAKRAREDGLHLFSAERVGTLMKERLQFLSQFYC